MSLQHILRSVCLPALAAAATALTTLSTFAQVGPEPTDEQMLVGKGTYSFATAKIATPKGYGAGTVYYPTNLDGKLGLVVTAPGFTETQDVMDYWAERMASFGMVVVTMGTNSVLDFPDSRARQIMAAVKQVIALSNTSTSPFYGKIDSTRVGIMGHSMGGGGTLVAARDNPTLKAAIPAAPWHGSVKNFSTVKVPTMIIACQGDVIAPVNTHADKFWKSLNKNTTAVFVEYGKTDHFCPTAMALDEEREALGRVGVAWMKRFVDNDTRYSRFIEKDSRFSRFIKSGPAY